MAECGYDVTDQEISWLSSNVSPRDMTRIAVEFLDIPQIDTEHAESLAANNSWKFNSACFRMWKSRYSGSNMRQDLYKCLMSAADMGLISRDKLRFLISNKIPKLNLPITEHTFESSPPEKNDISHYVELNQLAGAISCEHMEDAIVNVFGLSKAEYEIQKRFFHQHMMFTLLCSWWRTQPGSDETKKRKLREKLAIAENRGLLKCPDAAEKKTHDKIDSVQQYIVQKSTQLHTGIHWIMRKCGMGVIDGVKPADHPGNNCEAVNDFTSEFTDDTSYLSLEDSDSLSDILTCSEVQKDLGVSGPQKDTEDIRSRNSETILQTFFSQAQN